MKFVIVESRFAGATEYDRRLHRFFAQEAMLDCLKRGEAPFASHLLYTQVLNDDVPAEREWGIVAGLEVGRRADATVVYTDLGYSKGMERGIEAAELADRPVILRELGPDIVARCHTKART